ncbi:hypothetical protein E4T47_06675 [Aureobasidium subglaciale]|nr:hypothetical protein E4T47_06675 [Aureobasidium subglaciale]
MAPYTLRQPRRRFEQLLWGPLVFHLQRRHLARHRDLDEELWQACAIFGDSPGDSGYQIQVSGSGPGSGTMKHPAIPLSPDPVLPPSLVDSPARPSTPSLSSGSSTTSPLVPLPLYIIAGGYRFQRLPDVNVSDGDGEDWVGDWLIRLTAPEEL